MIRNELSSPDVLLFNKNRLILYEEFNFINYSITKFIQFFELSQKIIGYFILQYFVSILKWSESQLIFNTCFI